MAISEKAKQKLDEAGKEIKEAVDGLAQQVAELNGRVKERLRGSGKESFATTVSYWPRADI